MRYPSLDTLKQASWYVYSDEPVQESPWYKPRLSDPFILMPEESPDKLWHLFAHTWMGIEHFVSSSGFDWKEAGRVVWRGHYPYIFQLDGTYYLLYETHDRDLRRKRKGGISSRSSRLMITSSSDLRLWSQPRLLLDSGNIPFSADFSSPDVSRPQLIMWQGTFRLYFEASRITLQDSGQKCAYYFGFAESDRIEGPYQVHPRPILEGDPDGEWANMALGAVRIIPCCDGIAAIESAFRYDDVLRRTRSALLLLTSEDGIHFGGERLLMDSPEDGWAGGYITSSSANWREDEGSWYCYFSANCRSRHRLIPGRESLGLLLGMIRH